MSTVQQTGDPGSELPLPCARCKLKTACFALAVIPSIAIVAICLAFTLPLMFHYGEPTVFTIVLSWSLTNLIIFSVPVAIMRYADRYLLNSEAKGRLTVGALVVTAFLIFEASPWLLRLSSVHSA